MVRKSIQTEKAPKAVGPYSQAVRAGDNVYVSGQLPINPETGELVKTGIKEETKQIIENIKAILEASSSSLDEVVATQVFMTDLSKFADMNEVYALYFGASMPARVTVQVSALPKGAEIEMSATAYKG
ncbi:MAG: RidA family protein [Clostridia bacterium]